MSEVFVEQPLASPESANNSAVSLKTLKVFDNVIEDIKESKLIGEEKSIEQERAIEARVKGRDNKNEVLDMIIINRLKRSESLTAKKKHKT